MLACVVLGASLAVGAADGPHAGEPERYPPPPEWMSTLDRDHPLAGKLWAVERGIFQPLDVLPREIIFEDFVLLGEVHDNPDHHRLRAWVIDGATRVWRADGAATKPAAAVFEHIRADQADVVRAQPDDRPGADRDPAKLTRGLLDSLQWNISGWPAAEMFEPLFAAVVGADMKIRPGDAARETIRATAKGGVQSIDGSQRTRLGLDAALAPPLQDALLTELEGSHCGLMPKTAFGGMADAQRFRDATLADSMIRAAAGPGAAVLFAGNGHVRRDRAVPAFLKARAPTKKSVSVMFLEVEAGQTDPTAYVPKAPDGGAAVDFIVFTPRTARPDPCDEMRAMVAAKKK